MKQPFSIIANNCWGAEVYKHFNLPFNTPIIGLYFYPACFLKFILNLEDNLSTHLTFIQQSKYLNGEAAYPVGVVNGIEIHFLHYDNEQEAFEKWTKRCKRVSQGQLFFKFDDRDGATEEQVNDFLKLDLPNSICFTRNGKIDHTNHVHIPMPRNQSCVIDGFSLFPESIKYFDLSDWIKGNGVIKRPIHKLQRLKQKLINAIK